MICDFRTVTDCVYYNFPRQCVLNIIVLFGSTCSILTSGLLNQSNTTGNAFARPPKLTRAAIYNIELYKLNI